MQSNILPTLLLLLLVLCFGSVVTAAAADDDSVTILGLGNMGAAVLKCLASKGQRPVHAWNRGEAKRDAVRDIENVSVYETAAQAVQASDVTFIMIDDWEGTRQLILEQNVDTWKGKTVVLFSTYTPTDIQKLQKELVAKMSTSSTEDANKITLVGGAIVGVPQTICSERAYILTSGATTTANKKLEVLNTVGRTVTFSSSSSNTNNKNDDVGLAALANMALIQVITFGVAGQELAQLMIRQYIGDDNNNDNNNNNNFLETYQQFVTEIGPDYTKMLLPTVSRAVSSGDYETNSYVPVAVFRKVLQMHAAFLEDLGIHNDTFLATYLAYLEKVPNGKFGPAAWVEHAVTKTTTINNEAKEDEL